MFILSPILERSQRKRRQESRQERREERSGDKPHSRL
jgi:hypothetical protein